MNSPPCLVFNLSSSIHKLDIDTLFANEVSHRMINRLIDRAIRRNCLGNKNATPRVSKSENRKCNFR